MDEEEEQDMRSKQQLIFREVYAAAAQPSPPNHQLRPRIKYGYEGSSATDQQSDRIICARFVWSQRTSR